jgi:arsenite-transporting ATPase
MREEIVKKKNCVANIRKENLNTLSEDPIFGRLIRMQKRYLDLVSKLQDKTITDISLVLNEDSLSFSESLMIQEQLKGLSIGISRVIVNKSTEGSKKAEVIANAFPDASIELIPMETQPIQGMKNLVSHLGKISLFKTP